MNSLSRREREKLIREEEIIAAAEKIFLKKGFDAASMDEIAKEAEFTKRTLYQYFENKEDLYFAVVFKGFKMLYASMDEAYESEKTGYKKLQKASEYVYKFYKENPETFRILNYVGYVKRNSNESKRRSEFLKLNNKIFLLVAKIIEEGKADGSISNDSESQKTAFSLVFLLTAFFNQLSAVGNDFTKNFSLDIEDFSLFTIDLVLGALVNKQK
jgi:AcrR family transcriptional regulator